jgi:hypothetical protein
MNTELRLLLSLILLVLCLIAGPVGWLVFLVLLLWRIPLSPKGERIAAGAVPFLILLLLIAGVAVFWASSTHPPPGVAQNPFSVDSPTYSAGSQPDRR